MRVGEQLRGGDLPARLQRRDQGLRLVVPRRKHRSEQLRELRDSVHAG